MPSVDNVSQGGGDVTAESVLGRRGVVGAGGRLPACGLIHHHVEAISCNIYQLTKGAGRILPLRQKQTQVFAGWLLLKTNYLK